MTKTPTTVVSHRFANQVVFSRANID